METDEEARVFSCSQCGVKGCKYQAVEVSETMEQIIEQVNVVLTLEKVQCRQ